jgi:hypothetical protein
MLILIINLPIGISSDIDFDGNDQATLCSIESNQGFIISSDNSAMRFICRNTPLVTDVSTYWFGSLSDRSNWTQVQDDCITGTDSAISFSWQNILFQRMDERFVL